jgi:hypothetical protein
MGAVNMLIKGVLVDMNIRLLIKELLVGCYS